MFPGVSDNVRVFIRPGPTDMRKSINGLSALAQGAMGGDPFNGSLFVFSNRRGRILKILYWDRNGFCLWMKKLGKERFPWPKSTEECLEITSEQLEWLLRGLDFRAAHDTLRFSRAI